MEEFKNKFLGENCRVLKTVPTNPTFFPQKVSNKQNQTTVSSGQTIILQGSPGPRGPQGLPGIRGPKGEKGETARQITSRPVPWQAREQWRLVVFVLRIIERDMRWLCLQVQL